MYIPLTTELIDKWMHYINTTIEDIELREQDYKETNSDKCFWDSDDEVKAQSFYFANLCAYSRFKHKPYDKYLKTQEDLTKEKDNLFANLGVDVGIKNVVGEVKDNLDLSWLNDLM